MLTACASSEQSAKLDIPLLPSSVANAGKVTKWPANQTLSPSEVTALLAKIRKNEVAQARAVRQAQVFHEELRKQYGATKK